MVKNNQFIGNEAEALVEKDLLSMGFLCLEKQATPLKIIRKMGKPMGGAFRAQVCYGKKVSGDFKAIFKGKYVHVEVKRTVKDRLPYSTFEKHQHAAMKEVVNAGGVALVAWVFEGEIKYKHYQDTAPKGASLHWHGTYSCMHVCATHPTLLLHPLMPSAICPLLSNTESEESDDE